MSRPTPDKVPRPGSIDARPSLHFAESTANSRCGREFRTFGDRGGLATKAQTFIITTLEPSVDSPRRLTAGPGGGTGHHWPIVEV